MSTSLASKCYDIVQRLDECFGERKYSRTKFDYIYIYNLIFN